MTVFGDQATLEAHATYQALIRGASRCATEKDSSGGTNTSGSNHMPIYVARCTGALMHIHMRMHMHIHMRMRMSLCSGTAASGGAASLVESLVGAVDDSPRDAKALATRAATLKGLTEHGGQLTSKALAGGASLER